MKRIKSIFALTLALLLILSLAACGGPDYSGEYKLVEMVTNGQDMTAYLGVIGEVTLIIDGDRATLSVGEEISQMTVDTKAMTFTADGATSSFKVEDDKLTVESEDGKTRMVFEKKSTK